MNYWNKIDWREVDTEIDPKKNYTNTELNDIAEALLRQDARRELCRVCDETGEETGEVESQAQVENGRAITDEAGNELILEFRQFECMNGHSWFEGEGRVRGIGGDNPILFEEHFQSRRRREILTTAGVPDPSIVAGIYNRCVDTETEALSRDGWTNVDDLELGQEIWAYEENGKSTRYSWQPLREIFRKSYSGKINVLEGKDISARYTDGHKWLVGNHEGSNKLQVVTELKATHLIPICFESTLVAPEIINGIGKWIVVKDVQHDPVDYSGEIWCPRVRGGFWLARRKGKIFTTGNTHPQGRKVNSEAARKKHGASWYK